MLETFWNELNEGEIHVRDKSQFELKSEFFIHATHNVYKQEFFIFIPESLHVTGQTYSKDQFYLDETNLIRYKTPYISLKNLINPNYEQSPLWRIDNILNSGKASSNLTEIADELKLFAIIFKGSLRDRVRDLLNELKKTDPIQNTGQCIQEFENLLNETLCVGQFFRQSQENAAKILTDEQTKRYFRYVDEYISNQIDDYFLIIIQTIRKINLKFLKEIDRQLCQIILEERNYRHKVHLEPKTSETHPFSNESILHRRSLLNGFVLGALALNNSRISLAEKHAPLLGAITAGIAMLVYMTIFSWKVSSFVITSFPVILFIVFLYILKDRIKEGLKKVYSDQAYRWFPDYSTKITSPKGYNVGKINESFSFIQADQLPEGFLNLRNNDFNEELQAIHRQESIIQFKREVILYSDTKTVGDRRRELTTIFRFNVHHLMLKASDAYQPSLFLDPYTNEIHEKFLPKVYHLNIIIRNTSMQSDLQIKSEIKKFRVVADKAGIKRVEQVK
jgi:hypothetical protein